MSWGRASLIACALVMPLLPFAACSSAPTDGCDARAGERADGGIGLELFWRSADNSRSSYYTVSPAGIFTAAGGIRARDRAQDFRLTLSPEERERFAALVRATGFETRARSAGDEGDRSEITVLSDGRRRTFKVAGADGSVDALLGFCRELSLRQFRDVIDAQPQSGERRR